MGRTSMVLVSTGRCLVMMCTVAQMLHQEQPPDERDVRGIINQMEKDEATDFTDIFTPVQTRSEIQSKPFVLDYRVDFRNPMLRGKRMSFGNYIGQLCRR